MKKFEVGHVYFDQYACDHETISTIKIIKRTPKTVVFERNGKTRRAKLYEDSNGEYIIPDHYSMACVYRAERELLDEINRMDIGPAGLGGRTTALAVHIETYPTHIAGLPVAVNLCCHAYRHAHAVL